MQEPQLRVVLAGDVDHGKSTLIGRLLYETGALPESRVQEIYAASERRGDIVEWSYALDALQSERDQAVTIDTTRVWLRTPTREIVLIDAPGHEQFLRNLATGGSDADLALMVIDATLGASAQTRRQLLLLDMLGIRSCIVAVNKMDAIAYDSERFYHIRSEITQALEHLGIEVVHIIPIAARLGENLAQPSPHLGWFDGPTLLDALVSYHSNDAAIPQARLYVQGSLRRDDKRMVLGQITSGTFHVGDRVMIAPTRERLRIAQISTWPQTSLPQAGVPHSVELLFEGNAYVDRGDLVTDEVHPVLIGRNVRVRLAWFGQEAPQLHASYSLRIGTRTTSARIVAIERSIDPLTFTNGENEAITGDIVEVRIQTGVPIAMDSGSNARNLNRIRLDAGTQGVAAGVILEMLPDGTSAQNIFPTRGAIPLAAREERAGHRGVVLWMTGLPSSGKSTIADRAAKALFARGRHVYVLDGDTVRGGLCSDLDFSAKGRAENLRRVSEVAKLFADAGFITLVAFISPYRRDRDAARGTIGDRFFEVFVNADLATCESRDPKGLYARARRGDLPGFTGVDDLYEIPLTPSMVIDTMHRDIDAATLEFVEFIEQISRPNSQA